MESKELKFTLSARPLDKRNLLESLEPWRRFINSNFGPSRIESLFTSVQERTRLYGGRQNNYYQSISYEQVDELNAEGIGLMLTLSNHFFSEEAYADTIPILERIENNLNSVVITNDSLAERIREDFPHLTRKSSVIRLVNNIEEIQLGQAKKIHALIKDDISKALELYDYVTLSPILNKDEELLQSLENKDKIILFANGWCLYHCSSPICYRRISKNIFKDRDHDQYVCRYPKGHSIKDRYTVFELSNNRFQGYTSFKLVPMPLHTVDLDNKMKSKKPE